MDAATEERIGNLCRVAQTLAQEDDLETVTFVTLLDGDDDADAFATIDANKCPGCGKAHVTVTVSAERGYRWREGEDEEHED